MATTVQHVMEILLSTIGAELPKSASLVAALTPIARGVSSAGPSLWRPPWATEVHGKDDVFVELDGDVHGVACWDDPRGWGAYATLHVARGTLVEVESVVGPLGRPLPARPDDFSGVTTLPCYPTVGGHGLRVFADCHRGTLTRVTIHFGR
jgi:hypothetical protein